MRGVNALAAEKRALSASDPDVEEAAVRRSLALKLQMRALKTLNSIEQREATRLQGSASSDPVQQLEP